MGISTQSLSATFSTDPLAAMHGRKSVLTNLLGRENIHLIVDASAPTASFDVNSRVLRIPNWVGMSESTVDFLIGHEIGHALYTPATTPEFEKLVSANPGLFDYINVIEDARIERLVKQRYPGLKSDFAEGYARLFADARFGQLPSNLKAMTTIDRINLYFKLGLHLTVGNRFKIENLFDGADSDIIKRVADCRTFEQVVELSKELYGKQCEENQNQNDPQSDEDESAVQMDGDGEPSESKDGSNPSGNPNAQSNSEKERQKSGASGSPNGNGSTTQQMFDGASKEMQQKKKSDRYYGNNKWDTTPNIVIDDADLDRFVFPVKSFIGVYDWFYNSKSAWGYMCQREENVPDFVARYNAAIKEDLRGVDKIVNKMVFDFNRKKAADVERKSSTMPTGLLNIGAVHQYKWNENLFLRNEVTPDGKSHGIVLLLDWSGSFTPQLLDAMRQVIILTRFCRAANIPFEVFCFTSGFSCHESDAQRDKRVAAEVAAIHAGRPLRGEHGTTVLVKGIGMVDVIADREGSNSLIHLMSSSLPARDITKCERYMWHMASAVAFGSQPCRRKNSSSVPKFQTLGIRTSIFHHGAQAPAHVRSFLTNNDGSEWKGGFSCHSTPLFAGMIFVSRMMTEWVKRNSINVPSLIVLSDGQSDSIVPLTDGKTGTPVLDLMSNKTIMFGKDRATFDESRKDAHALRDVVDVESEYHYWCNFVRTRLPMNIVHFHVLDGSATRHAKSRVKRLEENAALGIQVNPELLKMWKGFMDGLPYSVQNVGAINEVLVLPGVMHDDDDEEFYDNSEAVKLTPARARKAFSSANHNNRASTMVADAIINSIVRLGF